MNVVHVVGCGTIGEPLIALLTQHREQLGIDEVTFSKQRANPEDRAKADHLQAMGARLAVARADWSAFSDQGYRPSLEADEAAARATVVVDCTPGGLENKERLYAGLSGPKGFIAQGSEAGFGKPYALGINDEALARDDRFVQVVSCNTHAISGVVKALTQVGRRSHLRSGRFVCMRRANDIGQDGSFVPGPAIGRHDAARFGTHHAADVHALFTTLGLDLPLWSSAIKLNTQYMHTVWFSLELDRTTTLDEVRERLAAAPQLAVTRKRSSNRVFSFGRDHGFYGRILCHAVVPLDSLAVREGREVVGTCFTPQDGNSLLSSVAATLRFLAPDDHARRREAALERYVFAEV